MRSTNAQESLCHNAASPELLLMLLNLCIEKKSSSFEVVWSSAVAQWLIRDRGVAASSLSGVTAF